MLRILFIFLMSNFLFAQKHELDFAIKYSVPKNNINLWQPDNFSRYDIYYMKALNDYGLDFFYKYCVWEKYQFYFTAGLSLTRANYSFPISQKGPREIINEVKINNSSVILKLFGIEKKFSFYDGKFRINLGWSLTNHFYFASQRNYFAEDLIIDNPQIYDYEHMSYGYDLNLYYNAATKIDGTVKGQRYWNSEYYLQFQTAITERLGINVTLNYLRNIAIAYQSKYYINYKSEDYDYSIKSGYGSQDYYSTRKDHFMGIKIGIYYAF